MEKWYAVQYDNGYWNIQSNPGRGDGIERSDILSHTVVGKAQAERNSKLAAMAPEMKEMLDEMYDVMCQIRSCIYDWAQYNDVIEWSLELEEKYKQLTKDDPQ